MAEGRYSSYFSLFSPREGRAHEHWLLGLDDTIVVLAHSSTIIVTFIHINKCQRLKSFRHRILPIRQNMLFKGLFVQPNGNSIDKFCTLDRKYMIAQLVFSEVYDHFLLLGSLAVGGGGGPFLSSSSK